MFNPLWSSTNSDPASMQSEHASITSAHRHRQALHNTPQGELPAARHELMRTMELKNNGKANIVGYLAMAHLMFGQKQYKEALSL